ncbi:biosynthetic-type acetolactate synthase large subunit [Helicovermis profundi]|uniref:Acetolactate synthase n=1 Tax=Helicovermis profundi TaxID=3065157 RepID=A0AAU9EK25_9FIRM|nr:acetolactate synthase large subunit [Clostridia bacterium S502]
MKVSDAICKFFETKNVEYVFGYPGGALLPMYESFRHSNFKHILVRNEQGAVHSASGYARISGKVGVCIATSGPGATNLITGIATAYMDSIPIVAITGQVNTEAIGKDSFQEADITGATEPFTKHNYLVKDPNDILRVLKEAFFIASSGRPGPVLIDIPRNVQDAHIDFDLSKEINILGYKPTTDGHSGQIKKIIQRIKKANRPLIYVGGGVFSAKATKELREFVKITKIPLVNTMMGLGAFPMDSPYYGGMVGFHGNEHSELILKEADLVLIIGARMSDRATMNFSSFKTDTDLIHIDIDPAEIGKNVVNQIPIVGDAKNILNSLNKKISTLKIEDWLNKVNDIKTFTENFVTTNTKTINPKIALRLLSSISPNDTIITADVGQNQIWAAKNFKYYGDRRYLTSGGLGTMGYSLSASIGAKLASPNREVICVTGDGGIQMLLAELGTLAESKAKVIILLFNNSALGMVKELQEKKYGKNAPFGIDYDLSPDFVKIAKAFSLSGERVYSNANLNKVYQKALSSEKSFLIECIVDKDFGTL